MKSLSASPLGLFAALAASVYKANVEFAKLDGESINAGQTLPGEESNGTESEQTVKQIRAGTTVGLAEDLAELKRKQEVIDKNVLAKYSIPLGGNEATLVFTGGELHADDFTALIEFVEFAKKQFERRKKFEKFVEAVKDAPPAPFENS